MPGDHPPLLPPSTPTPDVHPQQPSSAPRLIRSEDLFQGQRELLIQHHEEIYRLRLTRNGKLILNK